MNKKLIRLTESDLHRIVKESVNRTINEVALKGKSGKTYSLHGNDEESWDIVSRLRQKKSGNSNYNTMRDEKNAEEIDAKKHPNRRSLNNANRVNASLKRTSNASKDIMAANESFIRKIVKESVYRILRESIDPWEDAVYNYYTRERLPKGWERIDREDDEPIYRDPDFNEYVKDEYGNFRLIENSNHILTIKDTEETPFTRNKQNYKPRRIKGAFSQSYNNDNPSVLAKRMMHDGADFYDFVVWCKRRGLDPREYIDTTDFETLMWIDPDADDLDKININDYI